MARLNVNPTRMELKRLKGRLKTAERGHKLLKDKSDELVRRFSVLIKENKRLRDETDKDMAEVLKEFSKARGFVSVEEIENEQRQEHRDAYAERYFELHVLLVHSDRKEQCCEAKNAQHVEYVRTNDISYGDICISVQRSKEADGHFGHRCSYADDGGTYHEIGHLEPTGNGNGTGN